MSRGYSGSLKSHEITHEEVPQGASFEDNVELLSEKRDATREAALESINRDLRLNFLYEELEQRKVTLIEAIKKGLKKGGVKEQNLAAETLSLMCITLGTEFEDFFKDMIPTFEELIAKPPHIESLGSIISSFASTTFVSSSDPLITEKVLTILQDVFTKAEVPNHVLEAALDGWALVITTLDEHTVYDHYTQSNIQTLIGLLQHSDVDVRLVAAECIVLLFEAARKSEQDSFDLQTYGSDFEVDVDGLLDILYGMKDKSKAKKDKAKQRLPFKDIRDYIENGDIPKQTLTFKHQKYDFDTWSSLIQIGAFRDILGEGLDTHFVNNELLHQIFDVTVNLDAKKIALSAVNKRMFMSPSSPMSKANTKNMNRNRNNKQSAMGYLDLE